MELISNMNEIIISEAIDYINSLFKDNTDGHDVNHTLRVYKNAMKIAASYPDTNKTIISLAALLHDVDDYKLFNTKDNMNARKFLLEHKISDEMIEKICEVINSVSFSKNRGKRPNTLEGKIVQDADRLDAIGAIGIARTFAYGGKNKRSIESSLQHFDEKLLLLKDEMNTKEAKEIAKERHEYMVSFLERIKDEMY